MIDLHLHSNFSDGLLTPTQLIEEALTIKGLNAIALTDHDTIEGVKEFLSYGEMKEIIVLPGIEISLRHEPERDLIDVHVIGLNIDPDSKILNKTLKKQMEGRIKQKQEICKRLRDEFDFTINFEEVKAIAGGNSVGRPHIVEILIKNNPDKVKGLTKSDLFELISHGGVAYVERSFELTLEESIDIIEASGGLPILAHPGIYQVSNREKFISMCVESGIRGIEVEYTYSKNRPFINTEKANWAQEKCPKYYNYIAEKYNLIKSGGSDYHGGKKGIQMGEAGVPDEYLKKLL
ncbi:MAG: PHP domain-containing protein [Promethearchaeota archaeon]